MNPQSETVVRHIGYDTVTGQIIHTHMSYSIADKCYVELPTDDLKTKFSSQPFVVSKLTDQDPKNLDFIVVSASEDDLRARSPLMVDPVQRKLVARPSLRLKAEKSQITGDGKDNAEIEVSAVDGSGKVLKNTSGKVKISATRGKLSAPGGLVELSNGRATVTLTSVNETVENVHVKAASLAGVHVPAHLDLEFI